MIFVNPHVFGGLANDPYWSYVVLLMRAEGTVGATSVSDLSTYARTITRSGSGQISGIAPAGIGTTSWYTAGGSSSILTCADAAALEFGSADHTIEMWFRPTATNTNGMDLYQKSGDYISTHPSCHLTVNTASTGSYGLFPNNVPTGQTYASAPASCFNMTNTYWNFLACGRKGNTLYMYGGNQGGGGTTAALGTTATFTGSMKNDSGAVSIGSRLSNGLNVFHYTGYIKDLRVTNGVSRYDPATQSSIAFPTATFPTS